jgi:multidrug efflux pump subunit AcrB
MTRFFIDRPVASTVLSVVVVILGLVALPTLPIAQYPEITPPTIEVSATYPGANARDVAVQVATPIEKEINGVERMLYMESRCTNDGVMVLNITFELGTDLDMAQVLVQNRVRLADGKLPEIVKTTGVKVKKKSPSIILCINLYSPDESYNQLDLSNFAALNVEDDLKGLPGVGDVGFLGQREYSMRIWLDPQRVAQRDLTAGDIVKALQQQNALVPAGQVGQPPVSSNVNFQLPVVTRGRLKEEKDFEQIIVRGGDKGEVTRLADVGRVELGAKNSDIGSTLDGRPTITIAVYQLPGSNALDTADGISKKMQQLEARFPPGVAYKIVYDTTPFISESVHEVYKTLFEAVILVAIVVLFFLQDWKAMILPMIDVPVSLIGTLAIMKLLGFTLNNLTLFGLVLAIGIVVDDAIVVLENIETWMARGLDARSATIRAMGEITGPIIAITLVLSAVFLPSAFIPGITGQFFRQFALTISAAMVISAMNAMTMTPSRAVMIFRSQQPGVHHAAKEALPWWGVSGLGGLLTMWLGVTALGWLGQGVSGKLEESALLWWTVRAVLFAPGAVAGWLGTKQVNQFLSRIFVAFNRGFDFVTAGYGRSVGGLLRMAAVVLLVYGGLLGLTYLGFVKVPTGFIPQQDKGYLILGVQLDDAASLERTEEVVQRLNRMVLGDREKGGRYQGPPPPDGATLYPPLPGVEHTVAVDGMSLLTNTNGSNLGSMFVILKPFEKRTHGPGASEVLAEIRKRVAEVRNARVVVFGAPPVDGLGSTGGFKFQVRDVGGAGLATLQKGTDELVRAANASEGIVGVNTTLRADSPQLEAKVNETKAMSMKVPIGNINEALAVYLGSMYVNDVTLFDQNFQVTVQADARSRMRPEQLGKLKVRNADGQMVPLGTVLDIRETTGPATVFRYNARTSAPVTGGTLPGFTSGQAIQTIDDLAKKLPSSLDSQWTELTLLQIQAGNKAMYAFGLAIVLVFLVLAFQYESWILPLAVVLVVPMCLLSAIVGVVLTGGDINIFSQIGFIVLAGLACKNAILIVEYAKAKRESGMSGLEATIEACKSRLRPIVMTSFAFILGVVPLVLAHGAGAEMRTTLGIAVFSGMIGVTVFGIFLTPVFYFVLDWLAGTTQPKPPPAEEASPAVESEPAPITAIQAPPSPHHP